MLHPNEIINQMPKLINWHLTFPNVNDKFCLTPAGTHRHACWCTCVPFLQRLRAYRGLHPPRSAAEGWGPPTPPQLTLPTRTSPRPVGPPLPHARTSRLNLQRRPSSNLPTAASEDTSPRTTEAPLRLSNPRPVGLPQPHARTLRLKLQRRPSNGLPTAASEDTSPRATEAPLQLSNPRPVGPHSRKRGHLAQSNRGAPPAQQPSASGPPQPHARTPRLKLQRHPSSSLPTAASEDTSPRATEAPLRLSNLRSVGPPQPHARTPYLKLQRRPSSNSRKRGHLAHSNRGAPPAQQPSACGPPTAAREDPSPEAAEAPLQQPNTT